eukprot:TRINITY_DN6154_c0_g1_i1.p1 TRINITY_DN6154_c0_g1~~TRINITY_DN6154_c0_g1_i1.p1  ORF type:complete len:497 (-),score=91.27 TRINITY_DN6154_c0_g1_i1:1045-2463(-)
MEKLLVEHDGTILCSNDGAVVLSRMPVAHPAAKLLVQLSSAIDEDIGDGTTSVVVLAGSILEHCWQLVQSGIHVSRVLHGLAVASKRAEELLLQLGTSIDINTETGRDILQRAAETALHSKLSGQQSGPLLARLAVQSRALASPPDLLIVQAAGGLVCESQFLPCACVSVRSEQLPDIPSSAVRIAIIMFALQKPQSAETYRIVIPSADHIDRLLREEEQFIKGLTVQLKQAKVGFVLVQEAVLSEALPPLARHWLSKAKIGALVLARHDIERIARSLNCVPLSGIEQLKSSAASLPVTSMKLHSIGQQTVLAFDAAKGATVVLRGSTEAVLAEAERAFHDAVCVVDCVLRSPKVVLGGGVVECTIAASMLHEVATLAGVEAMCKRAFAEALFAIPRTLARNAGMNAMQTIAQLKAAHFTGNSNAGVDVMHHQVGDMTTSNVYEPRQGKLAQITLAAEACAAILRIDAIHKV